MAGPGAELVDAAEWLYGRLVAPATALEAIVGDAVYPEVAPEDAPELAVVYQVQTAADVLTASAARIMVDALFVVRAVMATDSYVPLRAAAEAIDARLQLAPGDDDVMACARVAPYWLAEVSRGQQYRHLGGIYRVWVQ